MLVLEDLSGFPLLFFCMMSLPCCVDRFSCVLMVIASCSLCWRADYEELFVTSQRKTKDAVSRAKSFIQVLQC